MAHVWFVNPAVRTLEVFADDALVRAEPFDAIELELGILSAR